MSITFAEGFDGVGVGKSGTTLVNEFAARGIFSITSGVPIVTVAGRSGGAALHLTSDTFVPWLQNTNYTEGCFGAAISNVDADTSVSIQGLRLIDTAGIVLTVTITGDFNITISYNPAGTANDITANLATAVTTKVYNYYELKWTSSLIALAINGIEIFTKTQVSQAAFTNFSSITGIGSNAHIDDIYIADDANYRGDLYVRALTKTATVENTGTVVGAANAIVATDSFDGTTSYINYTADGQKTTFDISDITDNPASILGVAITRQAGRNQTGSVTESVYIKTATENTIGGAFTGLSLAQSGRRYVAPLDPADGQPWTKTKINSMQVGVKRGV